MNLGDAEFHRCAGLVAMAISDGKYVEADAMLAGERHIQLLQALLALRSCAYAKKPASDGCVAGAPISQEWASDVDFRINEAMARTLQDKEVL